MVDPCSVVSATMASGLSISAQTVRRHCNPPPKEFVPLMQDQNSKQQIIVLGKGWFKLAQLQIVRMPAFAELIADAKSWRLNTVFNEPILVDVQETCDDSLLFSFGIADRCIQHEKIQHFLISGCKKGLQEYYVFSLLPELMGFQSLAVDMHKWPFCCSDDYFSLYAYGTKELSEIKKDVAMHWHNFWTWYRLAAFDCSGFYSKCKQGMPLCHQRDAGAVNWLQPEAQACLLQMTGIMIQDPSSNKSQLQLTSNHIEIENKPRIVPYFTYFLPDSSTIECETHKEKAHAKLENNISLTEMQMVDTSAIMPNTKSSVSSPERLKSKHHPRKKNRRFGKKGRDLFKRSQFHLYECMLTVIFNSNSPTASVLELTKASPVELTSLLNQIAVALAGSGLAILLFVTSKLLAVNALLDSRKLLNIILGLGFIWLSCAIQKLRDVIISVTGVCSKLRLKEKQGVTRLKRELNSVFFKAFTLMVFSVLRFV